MLSAAEELCGPADQTFELIAIRFVPRREPFTGIDDKKLYIELPDWCLHKAHHAVHQLAHETVHTLRPGNPTRPTNFEEGLAEYFGQQYVRRKCGYPMSVLGDLENARSAVARLIEGRPESFREMMQKDRPKMSPMEAELLAKLTPKPTDDEIAFLLKQIGT